MTNEQIDRGLDALQYLSGRDMSYPINYCDLFEILEAMKEPEGYKTNYKCKDFVEWSKKHYDEVDKTIMYCPKCGSIALPLSDKHKSQCTECNKIWYVFEEKPKEEHGKQN